MSSINFSPIRKGSRLAAKTSKARVFQLWHSLHPKTKRRSRLNWASVF